MFSGILKTLFDRQTSNPSHEMPALQPKPVDLDAFDPASFYERLRTNPPHISRDRIDGIFLGIAIFDALGVPAETLSAGDIKRAFGRIVDYVDPGDNSFFKDYVRGYTSDDTQLTITVSDCITGRLPLDMQVIADAHVKAMAVAQCGWGGTTRDAVNRLRKGVPWQEAGKTVNPRRGSGNGIPMKTGAMGAYVALAQRDESEIVDTIVNICRMSHPNSMAVSSGLAHVFGLAYCLSVKPEDFSRENFISVLVHYSAMGKRFFPETLGPDDLTERLKLLSNWSDYSTEKIISDFGAGSCYVFNSLPFSYMFFVRDPYSVESAIDCVNAGGDTDSNGAFVGAMLGALHGKDFFPEHLLKGLHGREDILAAARRLEDALGVK